MLESRNDADFFTQLTNFNLLQTSSDGLTPFSFPLSIFGHFLNDFQLVQNQFINRLENIGFNN